MTDLQEAAKSFSKVNVSNIKAGEDDGQVSFQYEHEGTSAEVIALVPGMFIRCWLTPACNHDHVLSPFVHTCHPPALLR